MSGDSPEVDSDARSRFESDGVVCLRNALPQASIGALTQAVDALAGGRAADFGTATPLGRYQSPSQEPREGWQAGRHGVWRRNIVVRVVALDSVLPDIAAAILDANKVHFLGDRVIIRDPAHISTAMFDCDETQLPVLGGTGCAIWIGLDPVPESENLSFVPRSQRWSDTALTPAEMSLRARSQSHLRFATAPGDLLIYHLRTWRAQAATAPAKRSRALVLQYGSEEMRFRGRDAESVDAQPTLRESGALDNADFPVVWPRPYPGFTLAAVYENANESNDRRGRP